MERKVSLQVLAVRTMYIDEFFLTQSLVRCLQGQKRKGLGPLKDWRGSCIDVSLIVFERSSIMHCVSHTQQGLPL